MIRGIIQVNGQVRSSLDKNFVSLKLKRLSVTGERNFFTSGFAEVNDTRQEITLELTGVAADWLQTKCDAFQRKASFPSRYKWLRQ